MIMNEVTLRLGIFGQANIHCVLSCLGNAFHCQKNINIQIKVKIEPSFTQR